MSGFGFIGGPGLVYNLGTTSLWMTFAAALGILEVRGTVIGAVRFLHGQAQEPIPRRHPSPDRPPASTAAARGARAPAGLSA